MAMPKGYADSADLQLLEKQMMNFRYRSYARMNIQLGDSVLDVGCGSGTDTLQLAGLVGATGNVLGIDYDPDLITLANQRAWEAGLSDWVTHEQGNATQLPFTDRRFNSCYSDRLYQHLLFPERVLYEMARVTKSNGRVVVLDIDWGTLSINTTESDIERRIVHYSNERSVNNGYSGRKLLQLFVSQDLKNVSIETLPFQITNYTFCREVIELDKRENDALAARVITEVELQRWHEDLETLENEGGFFASFNLVLAAGIV